MAQALHVEASQYDAVVIGAGFAGLYQLHCLRQMGLSVALLEAGSNVGGTWYWNRYPGARTDSPSNVYQFLFSDELLEGWQWSERFPSQPETERYLNWVADQLDLRRDIQFNARVASSKWSAEDAVWQIETDAGTHVSARFVVSCMGPLSTPVIPQFEGQGSFKGTIVHTTRWPKEGIDLAGKRVGVIGTGATGIQVVQTIASEVESLAVFQRTANYTIPMKNYDYPASEPLQVDRAELRQKTRDTFGGFDFDMEQRLWADVDIEERRASMERLWSEGNLALWVGSFAEQLMEPEANEEVSEFIRDKIRARIEDPALAAKLIPIDHGFGTHRVPLETGYYEAYARDNVQLIDVNDESIVRLTPNGIQTTEQEIPLDILICATGFDAVTGALTNIDVRGRDDRSLKELWGQDVRTAMGMQVHGFPNLFLTSSPLSPAGAFCNAPTCVQHSVEWITECIGYVLNRGASIEATAEFEEEWVQHHDEVANATLIAKTPSWYTGANIEGKPTRLIGYPGGVAAYAEACERVKNNGYAGFSIN
ncbi:MAG: acetone monooxygenase [Limisphaerales bacterium]|jgi:acetone monooxygenase